ncbi:extradiol ring-cleavage dioxygenase [Ferroacidibacillus organovorans]|uniref:Extradiol ring-cleavage dioxygenase n=1 Tax=Ferroacidibacillus organovorans TaxID=1765683 RepID=A0A853K978_9BACL|nr:extradiol ring-cleavage dioxygenase [Ferroacidibacillus organovorans]KYP79771.1 extradiol ring-cleavage dioxygenase [Ferroacidibacillus organovorans]OAG92194.1 extradiol ring-cleavage dioxygenase [Ferroacidibacillus organovorans]
MPTFVFSAITPHGYEILEDLSPDNPALMEKTRQSMQTLGLGMAAAKPDTIIVLTPHGTRIDGQFAVACSARMSGILEFAGRQQATSRTVDRELARAIVKAATDDHLAVGALQYATSDGPLACLALDWGAQIPLTFMPDVPVVVITPSRLVSMADHLRFGESLARAVAKSGKRVGLIASCDWAHAHEANGPYGYHPSAAKLDERVVQLLKAGEIEALGDFSPDFIEEAKPDGIWQSLILAGAIPRDVRRVRFLSYEAPTYFGLICCEIEERAAHD